MIVVLRLLRARLDVKTREGCNNEQADVQHPIEEGWVNLGDPITNDTYATLQACLILPVHASSPTASPTKPRCGTCMSAMPATRPCRLWNRVAMLAPGKGKTHRAYLWAHAARAFEPFLGAVVYDFTLNCAGEQATAFLGDWKGSLVGDDYGGYQALGGVDALP